MKLKLLSYWQYDELTIAYVEASYLFGAYKTYEIYVCPMQILKNDVALRIGPWQHEENDKPCSPKMCAKLEEIMP